MTTAARLYKYPFNDQMLIYAQRPDATACASLETWNEKMNCWVNRGAKGIALIDTDSERPRLKYVFDVSDVHKARRIGRDPYLWELKEEHKAPVLAQLEKTYGATDVNMSFEERIMEIADRIAQDYYEELLPELDYVKEGSFLDDLDELNLGIRLRETLASSISFTLLSRCGANMDLWKDDMNFEYIHEFNNTKSLAVIGNATTEMCKPLLMEIGRTIGAYERQIARNRAREKSAGEHIGSHDENIEKGLANAPEAYCNTLKRESKTTIEKPKETENHTEMEGIANETDIRKERGLSDAEPDSERGAGEGTDQVRTDEEELSEGTQERDLSGNDTDRGTESTLSAGTGAGRTENGTSVRTDGEVRGSERGTESSRSDELGSEDEQHQTLSGGNRTDRTDLHLSSDEQSNIAMQEPDSDSNSLSGSFSDKNEDFTELQKGILCFDNYLIELFDTCHEAFKTADLQLYGKKESISYYAINLLWDQKLYQELRFVLVRYQDKDCILVSTDLEQDPQAIIRLYSYRFKIECTFREMKQVLSGFSYQFWSKSMPKLKRYAKKGEHLIH